jgi:hypothetical protein
MPQPISTPTAAGTMAPLVAITEPTVAPMPQCTSGMAAICPKTKGRRATFFNCSSALSSTRTPSHQIFSGAPPFSPARKRKAKSSLLKQKRKTDPQITPHIPAT